MSKKIIGKNEAELNRTSENEQYQKQLEQEFEARARIVRWEEHYARKKDEAREEIMHNQQQEILRIQKSRDDALERIRSMMKTEDQEFSEERVQALKKAREDFEEEMRKLKRIVAETTEAWQKNIDELKIAYKTTEKQIADEIQNNYINNMKGKMENEELKARKERETQSEIEQQSSHLASLNIQNWDERIQAERELNLQRQENHLENLHNIQQVHEDFKRYLESLCQANVLLFDRNYIEGFSKKIVEIRREGQAIESAFNTCATYFKLNMTAEFQVNAKRHLKDFESRINRLKSCILDILKLIADFPDKDEKDYWKKEFRGIEDELSAINEYLIPIRTAFMMPRVVFKADDVKKLNDSVRNVLRNIASINFTSSGHKNFICRVASHSNNYTTYQ